MPLCCSLSSHTGTCAALHNRTVVYTSPDWGCTPAQAVPIYLSEVAPASWPGGLKISIQMSTTMGILVANCVNYGGQPGPNNKHPEETTTCLCSV